MFEVELFMSADLLLHQQMSDLKRKVAFVHPDLGIGGAERLVVDAAVALVERGHDVQLFTAHHDPGHCFPETRNGTLRVVSRGDFLPRHIFGRFHALFAYLRMIYAALYLTLCSDFAPNVIICDQISACIPFLKWTSRAKIVFYCHFPDQLLTQRKSLMKRLYRKPIDYFEEKTTGMADVILVNSQFTSGIFTHTFKSLRHLKPDILYPSLNTALVDKGLKVAEEISQDESHEFRILSINRFERKKNLTLALETLAMIRKMNPKWKIKLIMAGGFDPRVRENVEHFDELVRLSRRLHLDGYVEFLQSPSDHKKLSLFRNSNCLLYTPSGEHFDIVPVEAMYAGLPVVAVNTGGPLETVADGETGFLCNGNAEDFARAVSKLIGDSDLRERMSEAGPKRVNKYFSFKAFAKKIRENCSTIIFVNYRFYILCFRLW